MATQEETAPALESAPEGSEAADRVRSVATPTAQLPAVIGGKYRPLRLIAKGGMGAVYEVVHANTGAHLALKLMLARSLLTPELVERFRREARIHSSVKNEHVVRVVDADVARDLDDVPFLVMELLEGQDFERICLERRPTKTEVVDWMRQLGGALDKAHREGIVHRDLKPENLFLAVREGLPPIVKILDFGIAKIASETDGHATATGQILGTPRYMAPEQAVDAKQISSATDRFALGLIAFRLLCGRHYFAGDNWVRLLREVARGARERPSALGSDLGAAFDAWFMRACALQPHDRFPTCIEQVAALENALAGVSPSSSKHRRAARLGMAVAAAIGLAAAALGVGIGHRETSPRPTATAAVGSATAPAGTTPAPAASAAAAPSAPEPPPPTVEPTAERGLSPVSKRTPRTKRRDDPNSDQAGKKPSPATKSPSNRIWDEP